MLIFYGCTKNILSIEGVKTIKIIRNPTSDDSETKYYLINKDLAELLNKINSSESTPIKFKPKYRIDITYKDNSEITVFINKSSIKIEGKTFMCDEEIEQLIENYFVFN